MNNKESGKVCTFSIVIFFWPTNNVSNDVIKFAKCSRLISRSVLRNDRFFLRYCIYRAIINTDIIVWELDKYMYNLKFKKKKSSLKKV